MNKCIKIVLEKCNEIKDFKELNEILFDIKSKTYKSCNEMITMYYIWYRQKEEYKKEHGKYPNEKEMFGKQYKNVVESRNKEIMIGCNTGNTGQTNQVVEKKFKDWIKKGGTFKTSLPTFKADIPIFIKYDNFIIRHLEKSYEVELRLFNKEYIKNIKEKYNAKCLTFKVAKLNGNERSTLDKIITGQYKQGMAQLIYRKGKWNMIISFAFEAKKKDLDFNRILGMDLGIVNTATLSIYDSNYNTYDRIAWSKRVIDGSEIIHFRKKIYQRRMNMLKASKIYEHNKGNCGHGRKNRTKAIDKLTGKVEAFRETYNHKLSRYIVDFAVKNNCGIIQMENLSGFPQHVKETFLKEWSYYDLQNKIKYKAEELGIKVNLINPKYTSQRCSKCGYINEKNRDCKNNQSKFKCLNCEYQENADINASMNIALPNIDKIIKEYIDKSS